jgi:hypothetical protein
VAALIIVAIGVAAAVPLWMPRPLFEYSITGYAYTEGQFSFNMYGPVYTTEMPQTYTLVNHNTPLIVALHWQNKGNAVSSLELTLTVENANITWFSKTCASDSLPEPFWVTESDGQANSGTTLTLISETQSNSAMQFAYVDVMPAGNPQTFTVTFTAKDASNGFSVIPNGATTATYELMDANVYKLVV